MIDRAMKRCVQAMGAGLSRGEMRELLFEDGYLEEEIFLAITAAEIHLKFMSELECFEL
jgi:hypothetical protein